ncbi:minor tail protein [Escherichia coli]|nr:minor tail protein [Escherichia coli]
MAIKGLEQAVENLSRISKTAVPGAAAMAINRVASSAISQSASQVARETKVRRKLVKERARLKRPRSKIRRPESRLTGGFARNQLGNARVVLSRRRRRKKGQRSSLKGGGSVLVWKPSYFRRVYSATEKWPVACYAACGREKTVTPLMW